MATITDKKLALIRKIVEAKLTEEETAELIDYIKHITAVPEKQNDHE